mgnify:CR=1 FL=1
MKKVLKALKKRKHIVFFDFEGTQHSQEMIALGAVLCSIDKHGYISKTKETKMHLYQYSEFLLLI